MQRNLPVNGFNESFYLLVFVREMLVDDEENPVLGSMNQAFDELDELVGSNCSLYYHESQPACWTNSRDHVESEESACHSYHWSFSFRRPSGSRVIIGTNRGRACEHP
jgi:hypothetical protein